MSTGNNKSTPEGLASPASAMNVQRAESPGFDPELMRSLRMRPRLAAWVAVAVFVIVVGFALSRKSIYSAQSLTYVEPQTAKVLGDTSTGAFDAGRYDSYLQQQMQTAIRPDILTAALKRLPVGAFQFPHESDQSAVARLQKQLKVERVLNSYQLSITLQGSDAESVAATVNAVTNAYLEQGRKDEHETSSQRLELLTQERQRIQSELSEDRTEQATLSSSLGVANPVGETGNPYDVQLAGVRTQLAMARSAHDVALAQLSSVRGNGGAETAGLNSAADDVLQNDAGLASLKSTINQRKALLSSQMAGLTPSNPVYKQDQDEMSDLDRSLDKQTSQLRQQAAKRVEDKLGLELQRTASVEGMLNAQLAHQTATATGAAPKLQRASELYSDITRLTARFATVEDAIRGLQLEANGPGLAHLSVAASVPLSPEPSKRKLLLLLALPLALMMGAAAAVLAHKRDPLVYTEHDLQTVLGFPPIGVLPSRDEVSSATIEEYVLRLAAGIETAYRVSDARSFVFTAVSPSVSVTGLVLVLQEKLEELGFTVLITEAPTLLQPHVGGVPMPRLKVDAGSGSIALRHNEGHEGYAATNLTMLKRSHDLLLIDAPPLLHSAAAEYAVRSADAAILIAGSGLTLRTELTQAATLLDRLNVAGVGAVLKDLQLKHADPSFKNAIAVLETRWNAQAQDAARSVQAKRAAQRGTPVPASQAPATPADSLQYASHAASTIESDRTEVQHEAFGHHEAPEPVSSYVEPAPLAEEWDGSLDEPVAAAPSHHFDMHSFDETHEEEQYPHAREHDFVPLAAAMQEPHVAHEVVNAGHAVDDEEEQIASAVTPLHQHVNEPETAEPVMTTESPRNNLVFEPEDEPSERARVWLERLLNPNAASQAAPHSAAQPEPAVLETTVEPAFEVASASPVVEAAPEPEPVVEEPVPALTTPYEIIPMHVHHSVEAEMGSAPEAHAEEVTEVIEEYPVFHEHHPSEPVQHGMEEAPHHAQASPVHIVHAELAPEEEIAAEDPPPSPVWTPHHFEPVAHVEQEPIAAAEAEPVVKTEALAIAEEEKFEAVHEVYEEPVFAEPVAEPSRSSVVEEPEFIVSPPVPERWAPIPEAAPVQHVQHAPELEPVQEPRAAINGIRRAAELRETSTSASTAKLPARSEGTIQPETGRMTRSWGMLSKFGGEAHTGNRSRNYTSAPDAEEALEERSGR
ncbi:GumC family protein [Granulicella tundricola]|uniref:Lipopolysaccharide biosynthesis protein n=1 Tax=Granulicella tundricola (strain ATCC BAA-1859 / DSM 23138 / MP5ACTX9) TaxID=1198114 RepID=E8X018_GRATM|nr:lipopolysaccharide biosynthesis protein [Granulicella tundricola]ADW68914.1 lipopolysaccharide biosynthesis protein [Granulicella tundricola MP5ACTX9]